MYEKNRGRDVHVDGPHQKEDVLVWLGPRGLPMFCSPPAVCEEEPDGAICDSLLQPWTWFFCWLQEWLKVCEGGGGVVGCNWVQGGGEEEEEEAWLTSSIGKAHWLQCTVKDVGGWEGKRALSVAHTKA